MSFRKVAKFFHRPSDLSPIIINASDWPRPAPPRYLSVVASMFQRFAKLSAPEGEGRRNNGQSAAPITLYYESCPGIFDLPQLFLLPPPPCDLIQRSIRVATFRNEKLSFLSVALCEQVYIFLYSSLTWKYFYVRPRITNYFYLDMIFLNRGSIIIHSENSILSSNSRLDLEKKREPANFPSRQLLLLPLDNCFARGWRIG